MGECRQVGYINNKEEAARFLQYWFWVVIPAVAALGFFFLTRNFGKLPDGFHIGSAMIGFWFMQI